MSSRFTALPTRISSPLLLRSGFRILQGLLLVLALVTMTGASDSTKRFDKLGHNMICACGCGQILLECNHVSCPDSGPMISELHQQLGEGGSDKAIYNWFANKYGATVLASPIRGGFDDVAWITPIALLLLATVGTALLVRLWKARTPVRSGQPTRVPGLDRQSTDELRERIRKETQY